MSGTFSSTNTIFISSSPAKNFNSTVLESLEKVELPMKATTTNDAEPINIQNRMLGEIEKLMAEFDLMKEADEAKAKKLEEMSKINKDTKTQLSVVLNRQTAELAEVKLINTNLTEEVAKLKKLMVSKDLERDQQEELYKNCCWEMTKTSHQERKELQDVKIENRNLKVQLDRLNELVVNMTQREQILEVRCDEMLRVSGREVVEREVLKDQSEKLKYQVDQLKNAFQGSTQKLEEAERTIAKMEEERDSLTRTISRNDNELLHLSLKISAEDDKLKSMENGYVKAIKARGDKITELEKEIEKLKEELEQKKNAKPSLQDQFNGKWKKIGSETSPGFILPSKHHNWTSDTLVYELTDESFTSSMFSSGLAVKEMNVIKQASSLTAAELRYCTFIKDDVLISKKTIRDCRFVPTDYEIHRFIEDGLLVVRIESGNGFGVYKFKKVE